MIGKQKYAGARTPEEEYMEQENTTREEGFHMGNPEEKENMGQGNTTREEEGFHTGTGNLKEEENMEQENTTTEEELYRNTRQENSPKGRDKNFIESFEKRREDEGYEKEYLRFGSIRKSYLKLLEE